MASISEVRAKMKQAELEALSTGAARVILSDAELAMLVKADIEDALQRLGTSQRVRRARAILVETLKACDALIDALAKE